MVALFILMNLVFFGYISYIVLKYGVQPSVSESYYKLPTSMQGLFTLATWGYAIPAVIIGAPFSGLAFLAGAAICFVGTSPAFKGLSMEKAVHTISAVVGILAAQAFISVTYLPMVNFVFAGLSGITLIIQPLRKHTLWWTEILAFLSLSYTYFQLLW